MTFSDLQIHRINEVLLSHPNGLTLTQVAKLVSVNKATAARYLDKLVFTGHADKRKFGQARVYKPSSRTPLSNILDLFSSPVAILNDDRFIFEVNNRLVDLFGIPRTDLIGHNIEYTLLYPYFSKECIAALKSNHENRSVSVEQVFKIKEKVFYFLVKMTPTVSERGETGTVIVFEDITSLKNYKRDLDRTINARITDLAKANEKLKDEIDNQKRTKETIIASRQKYLTLTEEMPALIFCFEPDGTLSFVNENFCRFLNADESDLIGTSVFSLQKLEPLSSIFRSSVFQELKKRHAASPHTIAIPPLPGENDPVTWQQWTTRALFNKTGHIIEYLSIGIDVSDRIQAEQELAQQRETLDAIIRASPHAQFVINKHHEIIVWNTAMERFTGLYAKNMIGKRVFGNSFFYPESRPLLANLIIDEKFDSIPKFYPSCCRKSPSLEDTWEGITFSPNIGAQGSWVFITVAAIRDGFGAITHVVETMIGLLEVVTSKGNLFVLNGTYPRVSRNFSPRNPEDHHQ